MTTFTISAPRGQYWLNVISLKGIVVNVDLIFADSYWPNIVTLMAIPESRIIEVNIQPILGQHFSGLYGKI